MNSVSTFNLFIETNKEEILDMVMERARAGDVSMQKTLYATLEKIFLSGIGDKNEVGDGLRKMSDVLKEIYGTVGVPEEVD